MFPVRSLEQGKKPIPHQGSLGAMPRSLLETEASANEPFRVCGECQRAKTIRGVWYLVPGRVAEHPFVCETCFAHARVARAVI